MTTRIPVGIHATSAAALRYRPPAMQDKPSREEVAVVKQSLMVLFIAAVRVGPVGLGALLPRTITYNGADEGEADRWLHKRDDRPVRWFLREFTDSRESSAAFEALLSTCPELLEGNRDMVVRRVARDYAEAECEGLAALGWEA